MSNRFQVSLAGWVWLPGPLNTSGLDFKFSLRNELTQNTAECRDFDLAQPGILPATYL